MKIIVGIDARGYSKAVEKIIQPKVASLGRSVTLTNHCPDQ